jgi:hypothetical protein
LLRDGRLNGLVTKKSCRFALLPCRFVLAPLAYPTGEMPVNRPADEIGASEIAVLANVPFAAFAWGDLFELRRRAPHAAAFVLTAAGVVTAMPEIWRSSCSMNLLNAASAMRHSMTWQAQMQVE